MTTYHYRFQPIRQQARKNLPCPGCGKKVRRQWTVEHTVNPFNKNPDGTVKDEHQVRAAVRAEAAKWQAEPELCGPCADAKREALR
jgi:hypothetical protein